MKESLVDQFNNVMTISDLHAWEDDVKQWCEEENLDVITVLDILTA